MTDPHTASGMAASGATQAAQDFHLMAKPAGPSCNLSCQYCFYLDKKSFFAPGGPVRMADDVLEAYTRQYIQATPGPSVMFAWQGGEPTLMGLDFFRRALALQRQYGQGKQITNTLQTNGTLLDREWCAFLAENNFLVGLSLDGPDFVHDAYRVDRAGKPTHAKVMRALEMMRRLGVEHNVLAAVNRKSSRHPREVYDFFKDHGVRFIQFIPIVERQDRSDAQAGRVRLAAPPELDEGQGPSPVAPWSVEPQAYGRFLAQVFDQWVRNDVGDIFVMNFEWTLAAWAGVQSGVCYLSPRCGFNLIMEHDGDVFSCDHFMYPAFRLGNILRDSLAAMVDSPAQRAFGQRKETALPGCCRSCRFLFACRGGCPKQRFLTSPDGEPGLSYLCEGLQLFYQEISPRMLAMLSLLRQGQPPSKIMEMPQG